jgi:hypothetical protein
MTGSIMSVRLGAEDLVFRQLPRIQQVQAGEPKPAAPPRVANVFHAQPAQDANVHTWGHAGQGLLDRFQQSQALGLVQDLPEAPDLDQLALADVLAHLVGILNWVGISSLPRRAQDVVDVPFVVDAPIPDIISDVDPLFGRPQRASLFSDRPPDEIQVSGGVDDDLGADRETSALVLKDDARQTGPPRVRTLDDDVCSQGVQEQSNIGFLAHLDQGELDGVDVQPLLAVAHLDAPGRGAPQAVRAALGDEPIDHLPSDAARGHSAQVVDEGAFLPLHDQAIDALPTQEAKAFHELYSGAVPRGADRRRTATLGAADDQDVHIAQDGNLPGQLPTIAVQGPGGELVERKSLLVFCAHLDSSVTASKVWRRCSARRPGGRYNSRR